MTKVYKNVAVYMAANPKVGPKHVETAYSLGVALAKAGKHMIYGGGSQSLMGATAKGAVDAGGEVTGVITPGLMEKEGVLPGLTRVFVEKGLPERQLHMESLSEISISCVGAMGTLWETAQAFTHNQLKIVESPVLFYDPYNVWKYFSLLLREFVREGVLSLDHFNLVKIFRSESEIIKFLDGKEAKYYTMLDICEEYDRKGS